MPVCAAGHDSAAADYCDVCGIRVGGPAQAAAAAPPSAPAGPASPAPSAGQACPQCGTSRSGQFCEACGFDFASGKAPQLAVAAPVPAPAPGTAGPAAPAAAVAAAWTAVVTADRAYYDSMVAAGGPDAAQIEFPGYCPERQFRLCGPEMRIGRHSVSRGLAPEIDLTGPPADPGVSHLHAVLIQEPDGGWAVLDPGSANGTLVNGSEIAVGARVPLRDGDRVCVGAWTVLTIRSGPGLSQPCS